MEFGLFGITGGCFRWPLSSLAQDLLCMKQEGSSVLICHVPSLSLLCIHHKEGVQNLLATGGQTLPPEFPGSCTSSCWGRANLEAPLLQMGRRSSASALGLLLPHPSPQRFLCPVLSTQLGASGFFLLLLFKKNFKKRLKLGKKQQCNSFGAMLTTLFDPTKCWPTNRYSLFVLKSTTHLCLE